MRMRNLLRERIFRYVAGFDSRDFRQRNWSLRRHRCNHHDHESSHGFEPCIAVDVTIHLMFRIMLTFPQRISFCYSTPSKLWRAC